MKVNKLFYAVVVLMLFSLVGCGGGTPKESHAKNEIQSRLDNIQSETWQVVKVDVKNGREATIRGSEGYVMNAVVHVRLLQDKGSFNISQMSRHGMWISDLLGSSGDSKETRSVNINWIKTNNGWELSSISS